LDYDDTIAIVDDDQAILASLEFLLSVEGHAVKTYPSATAFLQDTNSNPRCLIVDQNMPLMTGLELVHILRHHKKWFPVMLITGTCSRLIINQAIERGVTRVANKPPRSEDIRSFIEMCR